MSAYAQVLYPGDVNNNGIINGVDLLHLGLVYGNTGPERSDENQGTDFIPIDLLPVELWGMTLPNGLDMAYADCNGDGVIDDEDIEDGILDNYAMTYQTSTSSDYAAGGAGNLATLELKASSQETSTGSTIDISLELGDENNPISEFYGLALSISFDANLVQEEDETEFSLQNNSWIDPTNGSLSRSFTVFDENGKGEIAFTRINQQTVKDGFGVIGQFSMVIEDDIISGLSVDTLEINIDSIRIIDKDFNSQELNLIGTRIIIRKDSLVSNNEVIPTESSLLVFPNPVREQLNISSDTEIKSVQLYSIIGELIPYQGAISSSRSYTIRTSPIGNGCYILIIQLQDGITVQRKIIITK